MDHEAEDTRTAEHAPARTRGWRFGLAALTLAAVALLALLPFWADARSRQRVPEDAEVAAAVGAVRADFTAGDTVWVEPSWWVVPWHGLEGLPGAEVWPFAALQIDEEADPVELLKHRRAFVIAGFERAAQLPKVLAGLDVPHERVFASERVQVARYDLGDSAILRSLSDEWRELQVARRFPGQERAVVCRFGSDKHRCGRASWMDVAPEPRVVWRRETRWLFTHPGPPGSTLEVTWRGLPRRADAGPTWLYLRVGETFEAVRHAEGGEVVVTTVIDGDEVDRVVLQPQRFWMERRAIRLPPGEEGETDVTFRIESEDNAWRETVLEADLLRELPAPLKAWATAVLVPGGR